MRLYLVRHGAAKPKEADPERPLTEKGVEVARRVATFLKGNGQVSVDEIRRFFPAITTCPDALLDNAGGSQVPRQVADAMRDYMLTNYVQLGADYNKSRRSTTTVERAHAASKGVDSEK